MHKAQNRAEAVALFRFGVIAPATSPHLSPAERGAIVRGLAEVAHRQPDGRETMISRPTLDRWIRAYRAQGLDGLKPVARSDTGALRRHPELFEEAAALRRELPSRSSEFIAERLSQTHGIAVSARTIRAQLASRGLSRRALMADPEVLGRYEAERVNQRWIGDFLVGPWVPYPKVARSRRAKLVLFVDDRSRLLVHGVWGFTETTRSAQLAFKAAILRRGVPESIYLDRGAAFIAAAASRSLAGVILKGRPPWRPRARAEASPATVRSEISSRSNSAKAAKIPKTSLPAAVVVSIAAPRPVSTFKPTPRSVKSWTVLTRWCRFRPSRSSFHTTRVSPPRSALRQEARPGRSPDRPEAWSS